MNEYSYMLDEITWKKLKKINEELENLSLASSMEVEEKRLGRI